MGTSKSSKPSIKIKEIFHTIQGEGPWSGTPAVFVRFAGCHLSCFWCDTDFSGGNVMPVGRITNQVVNIAEGTGTNLVVITGGDPLLQSEHLVKLIRSLRVGGFVCQIETAGNRPCPQLLVMDADVVVSPKTAIVDDHIAEIASAWKYIIRVGEIDDNDGLPMFSTQSEGKECQLARPWAYDSDAPIYVQPCEEASEVMTKRNTEFCVELAQRFGYRLSLQIHKILGLP